MHTHTPPGERDAGLTHARSRRLPSVRRSSLTTIAVGASLLLAACGNAAPAEQLGSAPVTSDESSHTISVATSQTTVKQASTDNEPAADSPDGLRRITGSTLDLSALGQTTTSNRRSGADPAPATTTTQPEGELPAVEPPVVELETPEKEIEKVVSELKNDGLAVSGDTETLDVVEPLDRKPDSKKSQDLREGSNLNESGEQNVFDQAASLACADIEVALTALDEGRVAKAVAQVTSAADRAGSSRVNAVDQWHPILRDVANQIEIEGPSDIAPLLAFLSTCTQGGYEL